eukprot:scaffold62675_cov45-Phaeocystis_antarctica.AAC.3
MAQESQMAREARAARASSQAWRTVVGCRARGRRADGGTDGGGDGGGGGGGLHARGRGGARWGGTDHPLLQRAQAGAGAQQRGALVLRGRRRGPHTCAGLPLWRRAGGSGLLKASHGGGGRATWLEADGGGGGAALALSRGAGAPLLPRTHRRLLTRDARGAQRLGGAGAPLLPPHRADRGLLCGLSDAARRVGDDLLPERGRDVNLLLIRLHVRRHVPRLVRVRG